ncbi:DUF5916 domain-containing protein [Flagellimonas sp.]|uniref:carbohydrate binding family 9 domain-containing protein n=1 Tax=Flagellimonas sp. TaxID=2058762 RepID=UPI003BB13019
MKKVILSCLLLLGLSLKAQTEFAPAKDKLHVPAKSIATYLNIDGNLDETEWASAPVLSNFIQVEPNQGEPSKFKTTVRVLYNEKYLYVGAFCQDPDGKKGIRVPDLARDFSFLSNDTFAVGIDGFLDERNSVTLAVNPYGSQKDYLSFDDTFFDAKWNGLWTVRTKITTEGWFAEFQIPWKTLRYGTTQGTDSQWGINFVRQRRKSNEISAWSPYPRAYGFNRSEYFGLLTQIKPPKPTTNFRINPYVLSKYTESGSNGNTQASETEYIMGGEIKWALSTNTLLDITANTDFAQAEADRQVNNISRFSVFFPERRQFFLENASLFGAGLYSDTGGSGNLSIIPFFSRRIGLDENGTPKTIEAGLRLVHQSPKESFGVMGIKEEDAYNLVGRYVKNFGKQNRLGAIATTKIQDNNNAVAGVDGFFRMGNAHSLGFMALSSLDMDGDDAHFGGYLQYRYDTNQVNAWWTQSYLDKNFNPELGFTSRSDVIATSPGIIANIRGPKLPFKKLLRAYRPRIIGNLYHQASTGAFLERELTISPFWLEAQNGGYLSFSTSFVEQKLNAPLQLLNVEIIPDSYSYNRYSIALGTDPSSKFSTELRHTFGKFYDGELRTWNASLSAIPIPHIFLKGSINSDKFTGLGSTSSSGTVDLLTLESRVYINPRLSLSGLYQRNTQNDSDFYNIRFAWEYNPLSYVYIVFNSNQNKLESDTIFERQAIIKLSFLKQF